MSILNLLRQVLAEHLLHWALAVMPLSRDKVLLARKIVEYCEEAKGNV